jgi:hypothetical protein
MISQQEALAIAKSLAEQGGYFWDDRTARIEWRPAILPAPCWAVTTGEPAKHWLEQEMDDLGLILLIDAQTGAFAGVDQGARGVLPASAVAKYFTGRR